MIFTDLIKNSLKSFVSIVKLSLALLLIVFFLFSCDSKKLFEKNTPINNSLWSNLEVISFDIPIDDTISKYNFYINIRNNTDYAFSNLYLFMNTIYPDKQTSRDTIECLLTDNTGKWYGKGWGKHRFLSLLIGKDIKFPKKGLYSFEFEQAMRMDTLANITDIGIRIEKSSQ